MVTNNASNEQTGASGKVMQAQGVGVANALSTATYPSTATGTGKVLVADGTNWVASTPTFPNSSATSGKLIISDGTNWIASTPTFPNAAGTSGNVLTSNGTNFTSAAPAATYAMYLTQTATFASPADSTTYYMAYTTWSTTVAGATNGRLWLPKGGTITAAYGSVTVAGTPGSTENVTVAIRLNDTTNTNITTTLQTTTGLIPFNNSALSISVSAGDYIHFMVITPAWVTNPTTMTFVCTAYIS